MNWPLPRSGLGLYVRPLSNDMESNFKDIPPLLHDARLSDIRWDRDLGVLHLYFECLRRNTDGTPIGDRTVDLKLGGVERVTACCSPANVGVKPSEFEPTSRIGLADLEDWSRSAAEAHLAINSPQAEFEVATACVQETLIGKRVDCGSEPPLRVCVSFEPHNYGPQGTTTLLSIDCESIEPCTNGVPLDITTWQSQFEAWWTGWRDYWSVKGQEELGDQETALEDTFIPAGQPDPPDRSYRPPAAPAFLVSATSAPAELLKPIEDYHSGFHERDWLKVAAAYPFFDQEPDERAARLQEQYLRSDYGRWLYVRNIDEWWCEGNWACVTVRGIEHVMGDDESPPRNEETVITYGLRKYRHTWVIATWSQGWPRFGSATQLDEAQTWREGWNLAE